MARSEQEKERRSSLYDEGFRVLQGEQEFVTYSENSSFRMWFSDSPWRYDPHTHSAIEIVLTLSGCVDYTVGDENYRVRKDEILIIPSGQQHGLNMGENSSRLLFLFEPEFMQTLGDLRQMSRSLNRVFYLHDGSDAHNRIREMLLKASKVYQEREPMWNTICFSYLLRIYALLCQSYLAAADMGRREARRPAVEGEVISTALNYINRNYKNDLTLDEVADFTGFSRFYFSRSFKQITGFTFRDYLTLKRVQVAMTLLIETDKPMSEVAEESGFGSIATFNRVFREHKKCTPTQYRAIYG